MTVSSEFLLILGASILLILLLTYVHVRAMRSIDPEGEYTMRSELHPRTVIEQSDPLTFGMTIVIVLTMMGLYYDSIYPFIAQLGVIVGVVIYVNQTRENESTTS